MASVDFETQALLPMWFSNGSEYGGFIGAVAQVEICGSHAHVMPFADCCDPCDLPPGGLWNCGFDLAFVAVPASVASATYSMICEDDAPLDPCAYCGACSCCQVPCDVGVLGVIPVEHIDPCQPQPPATGLQYYENYGC
jgi:hypothetical protein